MRTPLRRSSRPALAGVLTLVVGLVAGLVGATAPASGATRTASAITAVWSASEVPLHDPVNVRGRVTSRVLERRTVRLELLLASGWLLLRTVGTDSSGRYSIAVPTDFYRSAPLRVRATATTRAAAVASERHTLTVTPRYVPAGSPTSWAREVPDRELRVDPCRSVTYRANVAHATAGALSDLRGALTRVHQATGITFRYLGTTTSVPKSADPWPRGTNLVVAWGSPTETDWPLDFGTLSHGGVLATREAHDRQGPVRRIVRAGVVLNTNENDWIDQHASSRMRVRVLVHELGHTLGLGHVEDPDQRMDPDIPDVGTASWGAGDLTGLRRVGLMEGCVVDGS